MENFDRNGNGWKWKILEMETYKWGGVKREPKLPVIYNLRQKNFEKNLKKIFFDFENFEIKKIKRKKKIEMIELANGIILFIIFSIFCAYLCSYIIEALIGKK